MFGYAWPILLLSFLQILAGLADTTGMTERDMTLLGELKPGTNVTGWLASEKCDGVRCYWDGQDAWLRSGRRLNLPTWFKCHLPAVALDGELWFGRGRFADAQRAAEWDQWSLAAKLVVFDLPNHPGTWVERMEAAAGLLEGNPIAQPVEWTRLSDMGQLWGEFKRVKQAGGEGLVLRSPTAEGYKAGRSWHALKVK